MELRRLQHIVVLAEEGNFRRAAERVHLSQPAFSRSIQAAEAAVGLPLFDRGPVEARCTPAGKFFVERARALLLQNERLERDMSMFRDREVGEVTFGTGPFPAATLVPAAMAQMRRRYPHVTMRVRLGNAQELLDCIRREEHEFFVANARRVPRSGEFHIRNLGRIRGGFFVRAGHPVLEHKSWHMKDLLPFGIGGGKLPDDVSLQLAKSMGLPEGSRVPLALECDDVHILKRVALESDTAIVATDELLDAELREGRMVRLALRDFAPDMAHSQVGIVSLSGRTPSPAAAYFMESLIQIAKDQTASS